MILAKELMRTCYEGYQAMAAKLAPEIWRFKDSVRHTDRQTYRQTNAHERARITACSFSLYCCRHFKVAVMRTQTERESWTAQGTPGSGDDFIVSQRDSHNLLRPETVESLHILYSLTGDTMYQVRLPLLALYILSVAS